MNILVVDDDKDLLEMVSMVLRSHAMQVDCLESGQLVLGHLSAKRPDIVLMDIYLGDTDGRDLCQQLKTMEEFRDLPVILYSARNISSATIQDSLADDFIAKPFEISELVQKIRLNAARNSA